MRIQLCLLGLFAAGCASMDKKMCRSVDWEKVGRIDAQHGRPETHKQEHVNACASATTVDEDAYHRGWEAGRADYCTPENAFTIGSMGQPYAGICPDSAAFEEQHKKGWELFLKKSERAEVKKRIDEEQERRAKDKSVVNHIAQTYYLLSGRSPTSELDEREEKLTDEINKIEVANLHNTSTLAVEQQTSDAMNVAGAFTGTIFGFGLGHLVQGRYMRDGWKWTAGEVGTLGTMIAVSQAACGDTPQGQPCDNAWPAFAMLGWLGYRVWQSVDLWRYLGRAQYEPARADYQPRSLVALTPNGLSWLYSF